MKTPSSITLYRRENTAFDHLSLYFTFPSIKIVEDFDYDSPERGITKFEIDLPTLFSWGGDKDHWTIRARVLGFGLTLTRQMGY
jgi:hypothetical protein